MNIVRIRSDGSMEIEVPFETIQQMFANVGPIQEVFALASPCGLCVYHGKPGTNTRLGHSVSRAGKDRFESRCLDCGADLRFIARNDGSGMFPDLKDRDGNLHEHGGWSIFTPQRQDGGSSYGTAGVPRPPVQPQAPVSDPNADLDESQIPF